VPRLGSAAKHTPTPTRHSARINRLVLTLISPPLKSLVAPR
jgi:hypothetical protein